MSKRMFSVVLISALSSINCLCTDPCCCFEGRPQGAGDCEDDCHGSNCKRCFSPSIECVGGWSTECGPGTSDCRHASQNCDKDTCCDEQSPFRRDPHIELSEVQWTAYSAGGEVTVRNLLGKGATYTLLRAGDERVGAEWHDWLADRDRRAVQVSWGPHTAVLAVGLTEHPSARSLHVRYLGNDSVAADPAGGAAVDRLFELFGAAR